MSLLFTLHAHVTFTYDQYAEERTYSLVFLHKCCILSVLLHFVCRQSLLKTLLDFRKIMYVAKENAQRNGYNVQWLDVLQCCRTYNARKAVTTSLSSAQRPTAMVIIIHSEIIFRWTRI